MTLKSEIPSVQQQAHIWLLIVITFTVSISLIKGDNISYETHLYHYILYSKLIEKLIEDDSFYIISLSFF